MKFHIMKYTVALLLVAVSVVGCNAGDASATKGEEVYVGGKWFKVYDFDEGVVCYEYRGANHRPANCLPTTTKQRMF